MDGVIIDSIQIARNYFLETHPGATEEMSKEMLSGNIHEEIIKYAHLKKLETEEEKIIRQKTYSEIKTKAPIFVGMRELLEKLHNQGFILILNTNAFDRNTLPILEYSKITHLFNFVATAELSKSKVEKFKLIEEKYKTDKEDLLFITDTLGDIKEANIANISAVAVTWGAHDRSFFEREKYTNLVKIVDSVKELEDYIMQN